MSDVKGDIDYLILPVRNPLDNFDAWRRYLDRRGPEFKSKQDHQTLAAFTEAWLQFHNFWFAQNIPITTYRYEDITDNPLLVLESALRSSGIWALRNLTGRLRAFMLACLPAPLPRSPLSPGLSTHAQPNLRISLSFQ